MADINNLEDLKQKISQNFESNLEFKFQIKVTANSSNDLIEFNPELDFIKVKIRQRAVEGKANKAIIEFLAKTLKHPKSKIKITLGEKSSIKTICLIP